MKKINLILLITFLSGSFAFVAAQSTFITGKYSASTNTSGFTLDKNTGERTYTLDVNFLDPFAARPDVMVFVQTLDADKGFNVRYTVEPTSISRDGFTIKITTWADTKIYTIGGTWMAYTK